MQPDSNSKGKQTNSKLNCNSCKLMQRVSICNIQWIVKILFHHTHNNDKILISILQAHVLKLADL